MSPTDLKSLQDSANTMNVSEPGFVRCTIRSAVPPVLAHEFTDFMEAEGYAGRLQLLGRHCRIDPTNPRIVLDYR